MRLDHRARAATAKALSGIDPDGTMALKEGHLGKTGFDTFQKSEHPKLDVRKAGILLYRIMSSFFYLSNL
jgi:hypothetical protein